MERGERAGGAVLLEADGERITVHDGRARIVLRLDGSTIQASVVIDRLSVDERALVFADNGRGGLTADLGNHHFESAEAAAAFFFLLFEN